MNGMPMDLQENVSHVKDCVPTSLTANVHLWLLASLSPPANVIGLQQLMIMLCVSMSYMNSRQLKSHSFCRATRNPMSPGPPEARCRKAVPAAERLGC